MTILAVSWDVGACLHFGEMREQKRQFNRVIGNMRSKIHSISEKTTPFSDEELDNLMS